jgi:hypothetical protein
MTSFKSLGSCLPETSISKSKSKFGYSINEAPQARWERVILP